MPESEPVTIATGTSATELEPGHPLYAQPVAAVPADEDEQHRLARAAADHGTRRLHEGQRLADLRDVPAAGAATARARELERKDFAQDSGSGVSVQSFPVHLPVGPKRSVLTRSGAWPSSTSADATASTKDV